MPPVERVAATRRERAQARATDTRKAITAVGRAEDRLAAEEERRDKAVAAAEAKVAARVEDLDAAIRAVVEIAGTDQIAADLLDLPLSRIRAARSSKTDQQVPRRQEGQQ